MTLEEAIAHLDESLNDQSHDWGCEECKQEHEQLREWLVELKERRAADVKPVRWIPVEERLPKLFQPVIVCRKGKDGKPMVEAGSMDHNGWWKVYGTRTKTVTHWMPLPEPPREEENHDNQR